MLKSTNWKGIAELVGITAIVGSLIFVGLQMRQTQVIAQATLYQMRSDSAQGVRLAMIFPEHLQSALLKQGSELTELERQSLGSLTSMMFDHFENSHQLRQLGMLSPEQWDSDIAQLTNILSRTKFAVDRWNNRKGTYRQSFVDEVDAILQDVSANE